MGRSSSFCCKTCRKNISLGYGPYTTWLDRVETVAEYDALPDTHKDLPKNKNFRKTLEEHEDHDWFLWFEDWASTARLVTAEDGTLELVYKWTISCI